MTISAALITNTFPDSWASFPPFRDLVDRSVEVGLYSRVAYAGTQAQWDKVHAAMAARREGQAGSVRGSTTSAMSRIATSAQIAEWDAKGRAAVAARKAKAKAKRAT